MKTLEGFEECVVVLERRHVAWLLREAIRSQLAAMTGDQDYANHRLEDYLKMPVKELLESYEAQLVCLNTSGCKCSMCRRQRSFMIVIINLCKGFLRNFRGATVVEGS